jgi:hypothetical protein
VTRARATKRQPASSGQAPDGVRRDGAACGGGFEWRGAKTDYCRTDVTSGMRGCGYSSLSNAYAMSSGRCGDCYPNSFPSTAASSAYAYQPEHVRSSRVHKPVRN